MFREGLVDLTLIVALVALVGIAIGRIPRLRMDRTGIALAAATALVAAGALTADEAFAAIDLGTLALLLAMMIIVANLRMAGFFALAGSRILAAARGPRSLLALIVGASGLLSAFFLNDTVCLIFTPLVIEVTRRSRRDPLPYLIAVAVAANIGSSATIIGNPQNMLIGAQSGLSFAFFSSRLAPPALAGLGLVLLYPREFASSRDRALSGAQGGRAETRVEVDAPHVAKSLLAALLMVVLLLAGVQAPVAALVAAALLLVTRRTDPDRVFGHVDFGLLVFFASLFVITRTIEVNPVFSRLVEGTLPGLSAEGRTPVGLLSFAVALLSNLVSNVPAVMLFRPLVPGFGDPAGVWLILAMASTYAGNLTLMGSVANLIVAEGARRGGIALGFWSYLRVGLPLSLATLALGALWLAFT